MLENICADARVQQFSVTRFTIASVAQRAVAQHVFHSLDWTNKLLDVFTLLQRLILNREHPLLPCFQLVLASLQSLKLIAHWLLGIRFRLSNIHLLAAKVHELCGFRAIARHEREAAREELRLGLRLLAR